MISVTSTVTLASPNGGPPLPFGVPVLVDENDPYIQQLLDAGTLQRDDAQDASQQWSAEDATGADITLQNPGSGQIPQAADVSGSSPGPQTAHSPNASETAPNEDWKLDDLRAYVDDNGIDVPSRATKAEILDAINNQ